MNETYAAIIVSTAVFVIILCISSPLITKSQAQDDAIAKLQKSRRGKYRQSKRLDIAARISEWMARRKEGISSRNVRRMSLDASMKRADRKTTQELAAANVNLSLKAYTILQFGLGILMAAINYMLTTKLAFTAPTKIYACVGAFCSGLMMPKIIVRKRKKKREELLLYSMPDAMDLISVSTSSGLGFESAVLKIAEKSNSPCIQEFKIVITDIQHGVPKTDAYMAMKERCNLREMTALITSILQSDELGSPLADVLSEQAVVLRENRRIRAEERANKAPVKITVPLVFCIFPALLIVILGPAVYNLAINLEFF